MNVRQMTQNWAEWGRKDPLWAVLTDPEKSGERWDTQEFFETGSAQIRRDLKWLDERSIEVCFGKALDFGCGVGRLSRALAERFSEVHGVDISPLFLEIRGGQEDLTGQEALLYQPDSRLLPGHVLALERSGRVQQQGFHFVYLSHAFETEFKPLRANRT